MGSCSSLSAREDPVATDCTAVVSSERRRRKDTGGRPATNSSPTALSSDDVDEKEDSVSDCRVANPMTERPREDSRSNNHHAAPSPRRFHPTTAALLPPVVAVQGTTTAVRTVRPSDINRASNDETLEMDDNGLLMIPVTESSSFNENIGSPLLGKTNTVSDRPGERHRGSFSKQRDSSTGSRRRASQMLQVDEANTSNLEEFESLSLSTTKGGQHVSFASNPVVVLGPVSKAWDTQVQQQIPQPNDPMTSHHDNSPNSRSQAAQKGVLPTAFSDVMNFSSSQSLIDSSVADGSTSTRRRHRDQIAKPRRSTSGSGSGTGMMLMGTPGGRLRVGPGGVLEGSYSSSTSATEIGTSYVRVLSRPVITADIMHLPTL